MEYYLGEILAFAFPRIPYGTAVCNGQTMTIQQNSALFSLIGTNWGGDGRTTFGIPNLCGRSMIGLGQPHTNSGVIVGTLTWSIGNLFGTDTYTITQAQLPAHNHSATFTPTYETPTATTEEVRCHPPITGSASSAYVQVSSAQGNQSDPNGNYLAKCWNTKNNIADNAYVDAAHAGTLTTLAGVGGGSGGITGGTVEIGLTGNNVPIVVNNTGAGVNFCITTSGVYPSFD